MTIVKTAARAKGLWAVLILLAATGCSDRGPEWVARNQQVIDKANVTGRSRAMPDVLPQPPISLTFGGPASDVLYIVGGPSAWSIQTKVRGFRYPGGMD